MRKILLMTTTLAVGGCVSNLPTIPEPAPQVISDPSRVSPIAIEKLVSHVSGPVGTIGAGLLCIPHGTIVVDDEINRSFLVTVYQEFQRIHYPVTNSPDELFSTAAKENTRLRLAGRVTGAQANVCFPMGGFGDLINGSGEATVSVEWQVYDNDLKAVIATIPTVGQARVSSVMRPMATVATMAVSSATKQLLLSPQFQNLTQWSATVAVLPEQKTSRR
jgi:hypothetical protein